MKYEVSQQGYVDFLNTLTYTQQVTRTTEPPNSVAGTGALDVGNSYRNGIDIQTAGLANTTPAVYACNLDGDAVFGEATDGKDIACGWMSWGDLAAYLDWSGLRPMTELEFEKACRGTLPPLANEYAWGTTGLAGSAHTLGNAGSATEGIATNYSTSLGNANYLTTNAAINGPLRVGVFAANPGNNGRVTAGATFYGIMEMSGGLLERTVALNYADGLAYAGTHGNGALAVNGAHDPPWPSASTAFGIGFRGGSFFNGATTMLVSDRSSAYSPVVQRGWFYGGRGVRGTP